MLTASTAQVATAPEGADSPQSALIQRGQMGPPLARAWCTDDSAGRTVVRILSAPILRCVRTITLLTCRPLPSTIAGVDRLSALDTSFLHLEDHGDAHMHVAAVMIFDGDAPTIETARKHVVQRLHLVPRYRQRIAEVPFGQGRPVWVDDPHFNEAYHIRHAALPRPGDEDTLKRLAGRLFSQRLDRTKPLWEIWLVEGLAGARFALISKTHHALVDGVSGVDLTAVLFDTAPEPAAPTRADSPWLPRPTPAAAELLGRALLERATIPAEAARGVRALVRTPIGAADRAGSALQGLAALVRAGRDQAPESPFNVEIGPHRRYTFLDADLAQFKEIKRALGGTVNDVVLAAVAGALGRYLRAHGVETDGLVLKAMVPVSVRADVERGALGNRVAAMWAPLPVGVTDPVQRLLEISHAMEEIKDSGQAVGAQVLTELSGFAPPTIMAQAARLQARQRLFNVVVTNVPGPQVPLYMQGRELEALYPMVPLAENTALGIAIMSYNGQLNFGLVSDYDALSDLEDLGQDLRVAVAELSRAAGARPPQRRRPRPVPTES